MFALLNYDQFLDNFDELLDILFANPSLGDSTAVRVGISGHGATNSTIFLASALVERALAETPFQLPLCLRSLKYVANILVPHRVLGIWKTANIENTRRYCTSITAYGRP